jgi:cytochrome c
MSSLELNKVAAAVLIAGIFALVSAIIAKEVMHVDELENAVYSLVSEEATPKVGGEQKPQGPGAILALLAQADPASGEKVFKKCVQCHTAEKGGANRVGPHLWNVVGSKIGSREGYKNSKAMDAKGGVWDYEALNHFLYKPKDYVKGTKMTFVGLKKDQDRANIIAYLRTLSDSPVPLPEA